MAIICSIEEYNCTSKRVLDTLLVSIDKDQSVKSILSTPT